MGAGGNSSSLFAYCYVKIISSIVVRVSLGRIIIDTERTEEKKPKNPNSRTNEI